MSDKGFGDPAGRSVLKNPLLSSAVTGLSLEDLTHNAVLLPVARSQEVTSGRDQATGPQNRPPGNTDLNVTNILSGDVISNLTPSNITPRVTPSLPGTKQNDKPPKINYPPTTTMSKATAKSDDDFDVNEYFARLQGTRYVSAPINSLLKEESNANLEATEENLEEINLNEPEKNQSEVQQSLTADIAQNFSQLPTVLPQVASAVFSSFSNMLSMKSREQTPEESKPSVGYQAYSQRQEINVPLMGVDEPVKDVAPPPKEPPIGENSKSLYIQNGHSQGTRNIRPRSPSPHLFPILVEHTLRGLTRRHQSGGEVRSGGTSNYRITTKKKAYAQIPGLSSRDNTHVNAYPQSHTNVPSFFTPNPVVTDFQHPPGGAIDNLKDQGPSVDQNKQKEIDIFPAPVSTYNIEATQTASNVQSIFYSHNVESAFAGQASNQPNYFPEKVESAIEHKLEGLSQTQASIAQPNTAIIPPPPMFSNMPRRDSQGGIGKTILPPSVARRISANHPVIKQQISQAAVVTENIFVPTMDNTQENFGQMPPNSKYQQSFQSPIFDPTPIQATDNFSIVQTSTQQAVTFSLPSSASNQPSLSTVLPPPPTRPIAPTEAPTGFQADNPVTTQPLASLSVASSVYNQPLAPTSLPPPSIASGVFNQPSPPSTLTAPATLPPPPTKPIAPPSGLPKPSSIFQTSKPASLPPLPTNIFSPMFPTDDSQESLKNVPEPIGTNIQTVSTTQAQSSSFLAPPPKSGFSSESTANATVPPFNVCQSSVSTLPAALPSQQPPVPKTSSFLPNLPSMEINTQISESNLPPPPIFFNPNTMQVQEKPEEVKPQQNINKFFTPAQEQEPPKPVAEPPKMTGNLSYRMAKKRPQYYSGPIEGVGSISNNVKPVLPSVDPGNFHGALFIPAQIQDQELVAPRIEQSSVPQIPQTYAPFDISRPTDQSFEAPFDISRPIEQKLEANFNTAFDLSRQTTETYEPPKQETKGFGIIGSLKSKLVSLDINKIQNSVTTFFDPAYNDSKKDANVQEYNKPNDQQANMASYVQQDNLGICIDQGPQSYPQYNYQMNYQNQPYNYAENNQYYNTQEYYYQNQSQMYPSCTDFTQMYTQQNYDTSPCVNASNVAETGNTSEENRNPLAESKNTTEAHAASHNEVNQNVLSASSSGYALFPTVNKGETDLFAKQFFDSPLSIPDLIPKLDGMDLHSNIVTSEGDIKEDTLAREKGVTDLTKNEVPLIEPQIDSKINQEIPDKSDSVTAKLDNAFVHYGLSENKTEINQTFPIPLTDVNTSLNRQETESVKLENSFANYTFDTDSNDKDLFSTLKNKQHLRKDSLTESFPTNVSAVPLFDLSSMIADKSKDIEELSDNMKNVSVYELSKKEAIKNEVFDREASVSFSENDLENKPLLEDSQEEDSISEFNICETCREVNKPEIEEEKDVLDDLTTQLIENIIAPIQLSNPVEVPLTESNTPVDDRMLFTSDQCAEISHITEETIETIQGQSATKLLDDDRPDQNPKNYGWCEDDENTMENTPLKHDYTFHMNTNAIGFFGDNSMFFDDIPCNASDEIKAEFKNSQEDTHSPIVLPRQMSIPSAPPVSDDDSKSDETGGLDVHSIEQDAKKDFPLFEEFVIDPSETDDDKIEVKERERSSDDPVPDVDTFTNRVERFKKMGESSEDVFDMQKKINIVTSTSPAITIASYFDTGNYAAETHYRNSMSSSSPLSQINISSPNMTTRIPPGFESEYQRRPSGISSESFGQIKNEPYIPETSTQTKITTTTTFTVAQSNIQDTFAKMAEQTTLSSKLDLKEKPLDTVAEKLPPFATIFGVDKDLHSTEPSVPKPEENASQITSIFGLHPVKLEGGDAASIFADKPPAETLPDPLSFFASNEDLKEETDNSFNRLASYFSTPTKSDPAKSFFELSQSQNHYRHASNQNENLSQNNEDIPNNLINDLTSFENFTNKDQVVRTVNYFTCEYDNNININTLKMNEPVYFKEKVENVNNEKEVEETNDIINVVKSCNDCCNVNKGDKLYRTVMGNDNTDKGKREMNPAEGKDAKSEKKDTVTVTFSSSEEANEEVAMLTENRPSMDYTPVRHHWFYRVDCESKSMWRGFSLTDSKALEEAFNSPTLNENTLVPTDGGRYDVNIIGRLRLAVYWSDKPTNVRRCSWFYKGNTDARYVPYTESVAEKLEEEYRHGITTGEWHRRLVLPNNELVVMHGPAVMVHLMQATSDSFSSTPLLFGKRVYRNPPKIRVCGDQRPSIDHLIFMVHGAGEYGKQQEKHQSTMRPRVVRRGWDESEIEDPEPSNIDHLLLLCHGVGSACDMRFRSVEEVVDDFRATSLQLLQSHYRNSYDNGVVNRVEVLPISWHSTLHSGETGVDRRLSEITLESIPRLRNFTNDTVLDVLFYTSPLYCQTIINTVCAELNRIYRLFKSRNPSFRGTISLGGHSLGSVILYDLLCHQNSSGQSPKKRMVSGEMCGESSPPIRYPTLDFSPATLYALGSPIAMFECIRGVDSLGDSFSLPTCTHFFNIFHPYDPIAYRIEPLINRELRDVKPFLIPHHKGRKRMHLELKDTMARVGADLKQKLVESLKSTWTSMWKTSAPPNDGQLEKVVEEEIEKEQLNDDGKEETVQEEVKPDLLGKLNGGRRVDYVLQEAPFEMINEYLFAMSSHVCYWESEDTMLLMLREIYDSLGVPPDCSVPQQSMTVQRSRSNMKEEAYMSVTEPSTSRGNS